MFSALFPGFDGSGIRTRDLFFSPSLIDRSVTRRKDQLAERYPEFWELAYILPCVSRPTYRRWPFTLGTVRWQFRNLPGTGMLFGRDLVRPTTPPFLIANRPGRVKALIELLTDLLIDPS